MFFKNSSIHDFFFFSEEFFVIVLVFSLVNLLFSVLVLELLWPTHIFNFRASSFFKKINLNNYQSVLIKINSFTLTSPVYFFFKYLD